METITKLINDPGFLQPVILFIMAAGVYLFAYWLLKFTDEEKAARKEYQKELFEMEVKDHETL